MAGSRDRNVVRNEVLRVMSEWGVTPCGRGCGPGDVENWVDYIVDEGNTRKPEDQGWDTYWENTRMPREFVERGYSYRGPSAHTDTPSSPPQGDTYWDKLNLIEHKIDRIEQRLVNIENMVKGIYDRYVA